MNFQPMSPHPFDGSGNTFTVFCVRCAVRVNSADVWCDVEGKHPDFYCGHCAAVAALDAGLTPEQAFPKVK